MSFQSTAHVPSSPSSLRFIMRNSTNASFQSRARTTSESIADTSQLLSDKWKGKGKETTWSNDPDPFAATPGPYNTPSVRSASPVRPTSRRTASTTVPPTHSLAPTHSLGSGVAGGGSSPPVVKKQRASLFVSASDTFFSFGGRRRASILRKPSPRSPSGEADFTPILDIRATPTEPTKEAEERELLRNAAARAVGFDVEPARALSEAPQSVEDDDIGEVEATEESVPMLSRHSSLRPHTPSNPLDAIPLTPAIARTIASTQTPDSSAISLGGETIHHHVMLTSNQPDIPTFPCLLSTLTPFVQTSSTLWKHYPGGSFFRGRSRQWKSRYLVLTTRKPLPTVDRSDPDTQTSLHLFRTSAAGEKELERMKINEDSMVFVTDEGPEVAGRKFVLKIGGLDAGGPVPKEKDKSKKDIDRAIATGAAQRPEPLKVLWLVQCADAATVQRWIGFVKTALLIQRAERAGLGMSVQTSAPSELKLNGDLDVVLSLRAQGLLPSTVLPGSGSKDSSLNGSVSPGGTPTATASSGNEDSKDGIGKVNASSRTRSHTTTTPTSAVNALKGLFTASTALAPSNRPRSFSSGHGSRPNSPVAVSPSPTISPSLPTPSSQVGDEALDSLGNRASTLLNLSMRRATSPSINTAPPVLVPQPISSSITSREELVDMDFGSPPISNDRELSPLKDRDSGLFSYSSSERPTSPGSLPPPPRTRRMQSHTSVPRSPAMDQFTQDESKKPPVKSNKDFGIHHCRRHSLSSEVIHEESCDSPVVGHDIQLDEVATPSGDSGNDSAVPFPSEPGNAVVPAGPPAASAFGRSTLSFVGDLDQPRPPSVLSDQSSPSTPPSVVQELQHPYQASPSSLTNSSPLQRPSSTLGRRIPMMLAPPPSGPLPSAPPPPLIGPPLILDQQHLHREDSSTPTTSGKDRPPSRSGSTGASFFNPKRISTSSVALSIRSFNSGSSSKSNSFRGGRTTSGGAGGTSSSGGNSIRSSLHPPPRPTPTFAPPPTPQSPKHDYYHPFAAEPSFTHPYAADLSNSTPAPPHRSLSLGASSSQSNANQTSFWRSDFSFGNKSARLAISPPSQPPPSGALPPRPDDHIHSSHHQHRNSLSNNSNGSGLSPIPASPIHMINDLPPLNASPLLDSVLVPSPTHQPLPSPSAESQSTPQHVSFKARLRMMSTPSPRSSLQLNHPLPPTADHATHGIEPTTILTHDNIELHDIKTPLTPTSASQWPNRSRSNTFDYSVVHNETPVHIAQPIIPPGSLESSSQLTLALSAPGPPIPPRSISRPKSPLIQPSLPSESPVTRILSPPPRRVGRHSRDLSLSSVPKFAPEKDASGSETPSVDPEVPKVLGVSVSAVTPPVDDTPNNIPSPAHATSRPGTPVDKDPTEVHSTIRDSAVAILR